MSLLRFKSITITTLTIMLAVVSAAFVSAQQTTPPPPGPARPLSLPKIRERQLANGLTVILAPLPNVPKVTAQLTVRVGQATARDKHPGVAQLAAAVANEGTDTRTSRQIKEELRSIGGTLDLFTDQDATTLFASSLSEFSPKLFELMSDVIQHPAYPEEEVRLAKENIIQGIRAGRADPNFLANERFQKAVFGNHPYGFVVPDEKSINALTREILKSCAAT
ncbi:MAG: insulinase family protein [Pyrinomonadaceae bacterium]|nr:insulinase family protein [Pyrinomonadaceae bacterium]